MKRNEMINIFKSLAKSQGFYGRLLQMINTAPAEQKEAFFKELEAQNFKDAADLVIYIETC